VPQLNPTLALYFRPMLIEMVGDDLRRLTCGSSAIKRPDALFTGGTLYWPSIAPQGDRAVASTRSCRSQEACRTTWQDAAYQVIIAPVLETMLCAASVEHDRLGSSLRLPSFHYDANVARP